MSSPQSTETSSRPAGPPKGPSVFGLLKDYRGLTALLLGLAISANALNLIVPKIVAHGIDSFQQGNLVLSSFLGGFLVVILLIFIVAYGQSVAQTYVSERVAKELRERLAKNVSQQSYRYIQQTTAARLLTSFTSDVDAVKTFVSQAIVSMVSSVFLILGASILLLSINWRLALAVLTIVPVMAISFAVIFSKMGALFKRTQQVIDKLNKVINESILGASLIRVINAQQREYEKFLEVNTEAKSIGLSILKMFASLIPVITLLSNIAILIILLLGGHYVINGTMTLGSFSAFNSYMAMLIFPILMIGFMSSVIGRASASYGRISEVMSSVPEPETGTNKEVLSGAIAVHHLNLILEQKDVLKDVSFSIKPGTKTALLGPTAAGKTQLLYLLTDLIRPTNGTITYDGRPIAEYDQESLHKQVGFVFQDSVLFNLSLRENIAFSDTVRDEDLQKALATAELDTYVAGLPHGLDTIVSERGTSLSGGQKQRLMLARALALNPKILLLDDFTARVDIATEQRILENVRQNYPGITLVSVTQKIASVEDYDQVILLMEGEILAQGTHTELLTSSPEYRQIFQSQQSTNHYELHAE